MAFPWQLLALEAAKSALAAPQRKKAAEMQALKNKWSPYMDTSGVQSTAQSGLIQDLLGGYQKTLTPKGRESAMAQSEVLGEDMAGLLNFFGKKQAPVESHGGAFPGGL